MIIKSITLEHVGAFSTPTKIDLESDVTVFTGSNDSGKSCAINAIQMLCERKQAQESDVNKARFGKHGGSWNSDPDVKISAEVEVTKSSVQDQFVTNLQSGDIVRCSYQPNMPGSGYQVQKIRRGASGVATRGVGIAKFPRVAQLKPNAEIQSMMNLAKLNPAEDQLLKLAFGPNFSVASLLSLSIENRSQRLDMARENLNHKLKEFFPSALPFEFRLFEIGSEGKMIGVNLVDGVRGYAEVGLRGTGVKRMLSLMALLLQEVDPNTHTVILLDEPETSLHADAQHQLRQTLERLASHPKVQVVYATHSPSMVNPAHPDRIRVFSRELNGEVATSKVTKPTYGENFQRVRVSLGLTPSDSLLYGLVTILVEGDTEARCLGGLFRRLDTEGVPGFERFATLLESCHFVCGAGDSIAYYCKLAADQNAKPVVFLDGDKQTIAKKLREERPDVPLIELPVGTEFENLVPAPKYVAALASELQSHGVDAARLTIEDFGVWSKEANLPARMMFSKRIDRWISDRTGGSYNKHAVMEAAIRSTPAEEIETTTLRRLADVIREELA